MIVSDSTTLIILLDLNKLEYLSNLFSTVTIPQTVYEEVTYKIQSTLPPFIKIIKAEKVELLDDLLLLLDKGESEAIVLAKQKQCPLIIDEKKGRKIAGNLQIEIIGLLGIIYLNIKKQHKQKKEAEQFLQDAIQHGYRISSNLISDMFCQV